MPSSEHPAASKRTPVKRIPPLGDIIACSVTFRPFTVPECKTSIEINKTSSSRHRGAKRFLMNRLLCSMILHRTRTIKCPPQRPRRGSPTQFFGRVKDSPLLRRNKKSRGFIRGVFSLITQGVPIRQIGVCSCPVHPVVWYQLQVIPGPTHEPASPSFTPEQRHSRGTTTHGRLPFQAL